MTTTNHPIGEDAANVAIGEREALLPMETMVREWLIKMGLHNSVNRDQRETLEAFGDFIRETDTYRAALTAEKVAGQEPAQSGEPVAWRTTEPAVCVPMTEDPSVASMWREAGYDVIDLFERTATSAVGLDAKRAPLNGIPATFRHDEGAIARCSYCGRYSLDRKTLSDRQPTCECGEKHGWSGSFKKPGPDAKWSGAAPALAQPVAQPVEHSDEWRAGYVAGCNDSESKFNFAQGVEPVIPENLHPDTAKLVRRFARALGNKLLSAQIKYGYSNNWQRDDWADECRAELMRHIANGDPRDVAAYCAFLWHHDWPTTTAQPVAQTLALTDEQCEAIEYAVRWMDENVSNRYAHTAAKELRALLAAQPASSLAEGGE